MNDDPTFNYHGGNEESNEAHDSIRDYKTKLRREIVNWVTAFELPGRTCDEVEVGMKLSHQTASARLTEAKQRGELVPSGERRRTRTGRKAAVLTAPQFLPPLRLRNFE